MTDADKNSLHTLSDQLFRQNSGKLVAVLTRFFGLQQIETVMDSVQDTFESALVTWEHSGIPDNPEAWLMKVAKNKTISLLKRNGRSVLMPSSSFLKDADKWQYEDHIFLPHEIEDSQLRLLLTCCHPDFSEKNQVILTLNVLCGFGPVEISRALLMNPAAVKKTLGRMKQHLKEKGSILHTPQLPKYEKRVETVHTILYLMFNEGYKTSRGSEMIDHDLCYEAIRLTKLLILDGLALTAQAHALLALMFFNLARFPSRLSSDGEIVTLAEQDRCKWNPVFIEEGHYHLRTAGLPASLNRYYLEALIASVHCTAKNFSDTDWKTIVYLYGQLEKIVPSPVIKLNRLVAESYILDPETVATAIDLLKNDEGLKKHFLLYAAEGDLFLRSRNLSKAKASFIKAHELAVSPLDRHFFSTKISQC